MLTLGELLFYLCSTDNGRGGGSQGRSTTDADDTVDAVLWLLRPDEEQATQHYACKTIDNVLTKGGFWPERFAAVKTARALLDVRSQTLLPVFLDHVLSLMTMQYAVAHVCAQQVS